jgi:hypothetical protein
MKKVFLATLILAIAGCSTVQQQKTYLSPASHSKLSPATASYVYVPEDKDVGYIQTLRLAAYPAGTNTSTPTYTKNYTNSYYGCGDCLTSTATDSNGHVYVAGVMTDASGDGKNIDKLSSDLSTVLNTITIGGNISSIATDSSGNLWALQWPSTGAGTVYKFNSSGVQQTSFSAPSACHFFEGSIGLDGSNNLYLGCEQSAGTKVYERVSGSWSLQFSPASGDDGSIAVASTGVIWTTTNVSSAGCGVESWAKGASSWSVTSSQIIETYGAACDLFSISVDASGSVYAPETSISYAHGYVFGYVPSSALNPPWYTITTNNHWFPAGTPSAH